MIKGILLDFGGVLNLDGKSIYDVLANEYVLERRYVKCAIEKIVHKSQIYKIQKDNFWEEISYALNIDIKDKIHIIEEKISSGRMNEEIIAFLKNLQGVKKGIISNFSYSYQKESHEVDSLFNFVLRSGDVGFRKPGREIYEIAIKKIRLDPKDVLYIDDQEKNLFTPGEMGIKTMLYKNHDLFIKDLSKLLIP